MIRGLLILGFPFLLLIHLTSCSAQANQKEDQNEVLSFPTFEADNNQQKSIIYRSDDFGQTWTGIGQGLAVDVQASFIISFGDEMLLATDNAGLFLSKQNGQKWQQIGQGLPSKKINAVFTDGADIYVATYQTGIHLSQDYGMTWKALNYDLANLRVQDILIVEDKLMVGTDNGIY